jgi:choloylglycine hydrolase
MIIKISLIMMIAFLVKLSPTTACTTFLLEPASGGAFFGKNYDWHMGQGLVYVNKRGVQKSALLSSPEQMESQSPAVWTSLYGSITFNQYGKEFPNGGMNEKGLVIEVLWVDVSTFPTQIEKGESVTELQWVQYQLDNFATVAEVVAHPQLSILPMGSSLLAATKVTLCL